MNSLPVFSSSPPAQGPITFDGLACVRAREELELSAEQLAMTAGLATLTVKAFEEGRRLPRAGTLIAIRRALRAVAGRTSEAEARSRAAGLEASLAPR
jgi:transcriptional regulator with XRE-family HTH domain